MQLLPTGKVERERVAGETPGSKRGRVFLE
jgi:hypothetical protein